MNAIWCISSKWASLAISIIFREGVSIPCSHFALYILSLFLLLRCAPTRFLVRLIDKKHKWILFTLIQICSKLAPNVNCEHFPYYELECIWSDKINFHRKIRNNWGSQKNVPSEDGTKYEKETLNKNIKLGAKLGTYLRLFCVYEYEYFIYHRHVSQIPPWLLCSCG